MLIVAQSAPFLSTMLPVYPLLAAPPKRLALPAPRTKIAGYLPAPKPSTVISIPLVRRVVEAEIANPARLLDDSGRDEWWEDIQHLLGPQQSQAEREAKVLAYVFGTPAYRTQKDAEKRIHRDEMARFMAEWGLS